MGLIEFVSGEFSKFFAEIWREHCPIITLKNVVGEFLLFASVKNYDHFSEDNACFINSHS